MSKEVRFELNPTLKQARYIIHFEKNKIHALYHSLYKTLLFLNQKGYEYFNDFKDENEMKEAIKRCTTKLEQNTYIKVIKSLLKKGFLVKKGSNEILLLREIQKRETTKPQITTLYLLSTLECNFRCKYCVIEHNVSNHQRKIKMDKKVVIKGINLFLRNISKTIDEKKIIFYGGEPLLYFDIIRFAIEYIRDKEIFGEFGPNGIIIHLVTNGSLITEEIAKFLKIHNVFVTVSIDGYEEEHNVMRVYRNGRGTFRKVISGINLLKKYEINPNISFTIGSHNINNIKDNVKFVVEKIGIKSIGFNILTDFEKGYNPGIGNKKLIIKELMDIYPYLEERKVQEGKVKKRWNYFIKKKNYLYECSGYGKQIVITPDGEMGPCHAFVGSKKYFIPLNDTTSLTRHPIWQQWAKRSPFNMPICYENCKFISICGGGCAYNAEVKYGSIWSVDKSFCEYISALLESFIWKYYEEKKVRSLNVNVAHPCVHVETDTLFGVV